jgi:nucleotidyltransferase/DNA polymerase involved in DNA repair
VAFSPDQRKALLALHGVGPAVLARLAELGLDDVSALAQADAREVVESVATKLGSTCWKNSPLARQAIERAIAWAEAHAA